ncbi:MAG: MG2 domain-containing protein [Planctomycetota bacterium]|nr:MG2 domain-containing protein [Planctomycetota bacterium]
MERGNWLPRQKYILLGLAFLVLNAYWFYEWKSSRHDRAPGPVGPSRTLAKPEFSPPSDAIMPADGTLVLRFKEDMVPNTQVGKPIDEDLITLNPQIEGRLKWSDPRTLTFKPIGAWTRGTRYNVTVLPGLKSRSGSTLLTPCAHKLHVLPLAAFGVRQTGFTNDRRITLEIEFTDEISAEDLKAHLTLRDAARDPQEVPYEMRGTYWREGQADGRGRTFIATLDTAPVTGNELVVKVLPGLTGKSGRLGMTREFEHRLVPDFSLRVTEIYAHQVWPSHTCRITICFSSSVVLPDAATYIKTEPEVQFRLEGNDNYVTLNGDFKPGTRYAVSLSRGLPAVNGNSLSADAKRTVYTEDLESGIVFKIPGQYLSSEANLLLPIETVNVKKVSVGIERLYPNNVVYCAAKTARRRYGSALSGLAKQVVANTEIECSAERNVVNTTTLDLREMLGDEAVGIFEVVASSPDSWDHERKVIVVSDIGISIKKSETDLFIWANSLRSLAPVAGATVQVFSETNQELLSGMTDAEGVAHFQDVQWKEELQPFIVVVEKGRELSYTVLGEAERLRTAELDTHGRPYLARGFEACVFTDRGIYRPGETVHVEAIVRDKDLAAPAIAFPLSVKVIRPDGRTHGKMVVLMNEHGVARGAVTIPNHAMTGRYTVRFGIPGSDKSIGQVAFGVEEFVPPQLKVAVKVEGERFAASKPIPITVEAVHLFGQPAAGNKVGVTVSFAPIDFTHPSWPGFVFADSEKWKDVSPADVVLPSNVLDEDGRREFKAEIPSGWKPPSALKATICATVRETTGRATSAFETRMIDVYPVYVGICSASREGFAKVGEPFNMKIVPVDAAGAVVERETLEITVNKVFWNTVLKRDPDGYFRYQSTRELSVVRKETLRKVAAAVDFAHTPKEYGQYLIVVSDPASGASASAGCYARSGIEEWGSWSMEKADRVELELDKKQYSPGETAKVLARAPFAGKALITLESDRVLWRKTMQVEANTFEFDLPMLAEYRPNVYCCVTLIRAAKTGLTDRFRAFGAAPVVIDHSSRVLTVAVDAPAEIRPAQKIEIPVSVTDASGQGVKADVVVAAVDEGICMLTQYKTPDPTGFFEGRRALAVATFDIYSRLMPDIEKVAQAPRKEGGDGADDEAIAKVALDPRRLNPIKAARFRPVALWVADVVTDENGKATIGLEVPEFSGQLRLMVVAVGRDRFGCAERSMLVRRPLVVTTGLPRFLAPGDTCEATVELFNNTGADGEVALSVWTEGPLEMVSDRDRPVRVAQGGSLVERFKIKAADRPGKGVVHVKAALGDELFEETIELAVRPAAGLVSVCDYGVVEAGKSKRIALPTKWLEGTEEGTLVCSATPALKLAGSLRYLVQYPYGCIEQTTSSSFPLLYLADLAAATEPDKFDEDRIRVYVQAGVDRVFSMLLPHRGGFSMWPGGAWYSAWSTVYATHFLVEAKKAGYEVADDLLDIALTHLEKMVEGGLAGWRGEPWLGVEDLECRAYACFVLALAGRAPIAGMNFLTEQGEALLAAKQDSQYLASARPQWRFHLAAAFVAVGNVKMAVEPIKAYLIPPEEFARRHGGSLASTVRQDAIMLSVWMDIDPTKPLIRMLAQRLETACSKRGRWGTTQENAFALMALGKYVRRMVGQKGEYTVTVSSGGKTLASGTQADTVRLDTRGINDMEIAVTGTGQVFYNWISQGIPLDGVVREAHSNMSVGRRFLDRDGKPLPGDSAETGDLVLVELRFDSEDGVDNIVVEELLPAGLEIENPRLATSERQGSTAEGPAGDEPDEYGVKPGGERHFYPNHVEMRDDRLLLFGNLPAGEVRFRYLARAVTPGNYAAPGTNAECMYDPDIFSRGAAGEFVVKPGQ